jgi:hypothetical protein
VRPRPLSSCNMPASANDNRGTVLEEVGADEACLSDRAKDQALAALMPCERPLICHCAGASGGCQACKKYKSKCPTSRAWIERQLEMPLCYECEPFQLRAPCESCIANSVLPSLVPTCLPILAPSTNDLMNGRAAVMMPGFALSTPGPASCHTLKHALENLARSLSDATAHINGALLLMSQQPQQRASSGGSSYDAAPPVALMQATGSSNIAAPTAGSVAGMEQAMLQEGANVAVAIAAAVVGDGAQLQAAPQQASHGALPLDSLPGAPQGGAGDGTAPTSIEGSRRAHFPILTQGVVTRNNFMARPWVHHGPMRGPCVCPSWALKARAWANAHVGDGRPKRRPREAQAWPLRGMK